MGSNLSGCLVWAKHIPSMRNSYTLLGFDENINVCLGFETWIVPLRILNVLVMKKKIRLSAIMEKLRSSSILEKMDPCSILEKMEVVFHLDSAKLVLQVLLYKNVFILFRVVGRDDSANAAQF